MHRSICAGGVSSIPESVLVPFEPRVRTIRRPEEKGRNSGDVVRLCVAGFPDDMKDVQKPIASRDRAASLCNAFKTMCVSKREVCRR